MAASEVVITDFRDPDYQLEADTLAAPDLAIELVRLDARAPQQLWPHGAGAHDLTVRSANINRGLMQAMPNCQLMSRYGIGVDRVDFDAATEQGGQE